MRDCKLLTLVEVAHLLLAKLPKIKIAVDMTVGNGYDTVFLSDHFPIVYGFDIQTSALVKAKEKVVKDNVTLINDDHYNFATYVDKVDLFVFNLGWLPGSDKEIKTSATSISKTLDKCKAHLNKEGVICIICYNGSRLQREESEAVINWIDKQNDFFVQQLILPKSNNAPILYILALKTI